MSNGNYEKLVKEARRTVSFDTGSLLEEMADAIEDLLRQVKGTKR